MSTISIDYRFIAESDSSPLLVFDNRGDILFLNNAAEVVMNHIDRRDLFDIALNHAPKSFGTKTTLIDLHYRQLSFYAVNISYMNEEWLALRLYYRPLAKRCAKVDKDNLIKTDINTILDASLTMFEVNYRGNISLFTDQNIPPFLMDQNGFSKILRKIFESFRDSPGLDISLKLAIGEYMIIENTRYKIIQLGISSTKRSTSKDKEILSLSESLQIAVSFDKKSAIVDIPLLG